MGRLIIIPTTSTRAVNVGGAAKGLSGLAGAGGRVELVVLEADELDEVRFGQQPLVDAHRPWLRVRLRVVNRHVDLQRAHVRSSEALDDTPLGREWRSVDVEPPAVLEVRALDDQCVAFPAPARVPEP